MTSYAVSIYRCPRCHAELGQQYLASSNTIGRTNKRAAKGDRPAGELHPDIAKIKVALESGFPLFYTDSFVFDVYSSQYFYLGRCGKCSVLFPPDDFKLSTELHGSYLARDEVKQVEEFSAKFEIPDLYRDALLVDGELHKAPSLIVGRDFVRAVGRKSWASATEERSVRLGAFIQMNHHRRPLKLPLEWTGWPLPDELSSLDWDFIEYLGGRRADWMGIPSPWATSGTGNVPTRPVHFDRREAFGDDKSIPRPWASEQARAMIAEANSGDWPLDGLQTPMSPLEEENVRALIDLLGNTDNERLMRAECFRSLGDFDACLNEIASLRDCDSDLGLTARAIERRASVADPYVALVEGREFVRQVKSERAKVTFSIPCPGFGHIPKIDEEIANELPRCGCQIMISRLGRRVFIESETGRTQAPGGIVLERVTEDECKDMLASGAHQSLPRKLGQTPDGATATVTDSHIEYGEKQIWLNDEDDPYTIDLQRALELIRGKEAADARSIILNFEEEGIQVIGGRYGSLVTRRKGRSGDKETNARVPKDQDPRSLTLDECKELLAEAKRERKSRFGEKRADPFLAKFDRPGIYVIHHNSTLCLIDIFEDLRVQLPEKTDPSSLSLEDCEALLADAERIDRRVKNFPEEGIYIWDFGHFGRRYSVVDRRTDTVARVPNDRDPNNLTLHECKQLLSAERASKLERNS